MVRKSLDDVPYVVFVNFIMKFIGIKEVGNLSMVSKRLNEVFDNNEIWKILYSRTRGLRITDDSIHIHNCNRNDKRNVEKVAPIYWFPGTQQRTVSFMDGGFTGCRCFLNIKYSDFNRFLPLCVVSNSHPEYKDTRYVQEQTSNVQQHYYDYCKSIHEDLNKKDGFSTVNLCRNLDHYIPETLKTDEVKVNHKSFKKITLEKINTKRKLKIKKQTSQLVKNENELSAKKNELERVLLKIRQLRQTITSEKAVLDKDNNFKTKSDLTISLIDKKLYPKKQKQKPIQKTIENQGGFHKTPAEWQAKYPNMPNPPGTMGFSRASGMSGWIPKPEDRWFRIYSKEYNEYYYHNFLSKKSEWTEPKYWLDY